MKTLLAISLLALSPALAAAQESSTASLLSPDPLRALDRESLRPEWTRLPETDPASEFRINAEESRNFSALPRQEVGPIGDETITPHVRSALSVYGRATFPSNTDVTTDHIWYSDLFDVGYGLGIELDILSYVTPQWAVGGYLSANWDRFGGNTFDDGFTIMRPDDWDVYTIFLGGKIFQRPSPFVTWEGRIGVGMVRYASVKFSGVDINGPFTDVPMFDSSVSAAFEIGGRIGFGSPHVQVDFGFGVRFLGAPQESAQTVGFNPDIFVTFLLEAGLSLRF